MIDVKPCDAWAKKLDAAHRTALSGRALAELKAHVATCEACAAAQAHYAIEAHQIPDVEVNGALPAPAAPGPPAVDHGLLQSQKAMWARRKARRAHRILEIVACIGVLGCVLLVALAILFPSASAPVTRPGAQTTRIPGVPGAIPADGFTVVGDPTISVEQINSILAYYHSPAAGKGQTIYDLGVRYHIDPVVALAFFHHESGFGRFGEASHTHSPGNLRCISDHPCVDKQRGGYAQFASWEDGFDAWYKLIHDLYVGQWKLTTVNQIISKYAPVKNPQDAAHRNYVTFINRDIALWRSGKIHS
ncbi:hypothetical protein KDH_73570 [Dictyobacter sp. S3.2.2.5]|uniref:Mannosyl-glycoprotein endo-beta-N-acetylglucosamidase-like domain-containing protein n=1 Tax=Dictyobacter halimunensis TaxID=3026934 RepID=A0ABQ6G6U1_9CHLR|nr:hypothetical protein KDH_73570 [Dictyobacter sp. S3.2.2.5]